MHYGHALGRAVAFLNGEEYVEQYEDEYYVEELDAADRQELRELVTAWVECGGDWQVFLSGMPASTRRAFARGTYYLPEDSQELVLVPMPSPHPDATPAQHIFLQFVLHHESWRLGGPCPKCGRFYLRKKAHEQVYCSTRCNVRDKAQAAMQKKRHAAHAAELQKVQKAIMLWQEKKKQGDWRAWVDLQTGISPRKLAVWVGKGWIEAPRAKRAGRA